MKQLVGLARSGIPWSVELGFELLHMDAGMGRVGMPWRADLVAADSYDSIATGVIASLIDHCCGMAVLTMLDQPAGISTLNLKIDHFRPSKGRRAITAEACCVHRTAMMAFVRADVWDGEPGQQIAAAQAAFAINRPASSDVHHGRG